ncbi:hypothetical protein WMY93_015568 [Mugilogobius chulae]|uniref:Uncharacterized protein n=1 Tax=Mugilogobius chulae TaxID=88201 RepID=A0AAW0NV91_9GOBI
MKHLRLKTSGTGLLLVPESGLNLDRPPAGARVRSKHGPFSCWCQSQDKTWTGLLLVPESGLNMKSRLNMDRPPAGARVRTKHGPPAGARVRTKHGPASCWCQSQD